MKKLQNLKNASLSKAAMRKVTGGMLPFCIDCYEDQLEPQTGCREWHCRCEQCIEQATGPQGTCAQWHC